MKRGATAVVAAVALACAAPAGATTQKLSPAEQSLQRQITALQKQVKTLKAQVTTLKKQTTTANEIGIAALAFSVCGAAATADTFTATFATIDTLAQGTQGKTYIGSQPGVSDQGACQALRVPRSTTPPPSVSELSSLLALISGGSVFEAAHSFARSNWSAFTP
jgi:cell division protein FtsB